jgi:exopolysaccharide biosynthesis polyprenyl glycosylphosphotransferase
MNLLRFLLFFPFIIVLPAFIFWPKTEWFSPTLTNWISYFALTFGLLTAWLVLNGLRRFPGERTALSVIPVSAMAFGSMLYILWTFRLPYSVYYLMTGVILSVIYLFAECLYTAKQGVHLYYIETSGMDDLPQLSFVYWHKLDMPTLPEKAKRVVTNLHAPELDDQWQRFLADCTLKGIAVYNIRQVQESLTGRVKIRHLYENDLGSLLPSPAYVVVKRILDIILILITLPISIPLMLLTALAIKLESKGNVLFIQNRIGQGGREFKIYKFRSMSMNSEQDGAKLAQVGDARVTRVGKFIRKTRLDELPQFFNILRGDMSLIGPRPEQKVFVEQFNQSIPFYNYRHIVKPGLSGWAQVTQGYAGDTNETQIKLEHDFYYIKHFSLSLDILIIFKTIKTIATGFGAR